MLRIWNAQVKRAPNKNSPIAFKLNIYNSLCGVQWFLKIQLETVGFFSKQFFSNNLTEMFATYIRLSNNGLISKLSFFGDNSLFEKYEMFCSKKHIFCYCCFFVFYLEEKFLSIVSHDLCHFDTNKCVFTLTTVLICYYRR